MRKRRRKYSRQGRNQGAVRSRTLHCIENSKGAACLSFLKPNRHEAHTHGGGGAAVEEDEWGGEERSASSRGRRISWQKPCTTAPYR